MRIDGGLDYGAGRARIVLISMLKKLAPPIILEFIRAIRVKNIRFVGEYSNWNEAVLDAKGYTAPEILDKVVFATRSVKNGKASFERDGYLFHEIQYSYPLLTAMLRTAARGKGRLSVIDFGGALGSTYNQCKLFLVGLPELAWHVVEQANFVEAGRREFETSILKFSSDLSCSLKQAQPNVVVFSGVLQYLEMPYDILQQVIDANVEMIIVDRTPFSELNVDLIKLQVVSGRISKSSYPVRIFGRDSIENILKNKYKKIIDFDAIDGILGSSKFPIEFKGCVYERRNHENS